MFKDKVGHIWDIGPSGVKDQRYPLMITHSCRPEGKMYPTSAFGRKVKYPTCLFCSMLVPQNIVDIALFAGLMIV